MPGALLVEGNESSMAALGGRVYTLPAGSISCAVAAPLMICRSTGALGGAKVALLMKKFEPFYVRWRWVGMDSAQSAARGERDSRS